MKLKEIAQKMNYTRDGEGNYYCKCGDKLSSNILPIIQKQFGYCEKCKGDGIIRNLNSEKWSIQKDCANFILKL